MWRPKPAIDAFRALISSKIGDSSSRIYQTGNGCRYGLSSMHSSSTTAPVATANRAKYSGSSPFFGSLLRQKSVYSSVGSSRNQFFNPSLNGAKRYYYVDRRNLQHFRRKGFDKWFENPRNMLIVVVVGSGLVVTVYFGNLETVPYSKRKHVVLLSNVLERKIGEQQFEQIKAGFKGKILPPIHPESIRVRLISKDIIDALQRGFKKETVWNDLDYASAETDVGAHEKGTVETISTLTEGEGKMEDMWRKEDEVLDENWIEKSRQKGQQKGSEAYTSHLEGVNWEILVVNEPVVNAFCLPGGKIVVFTGLLEHFRTDDEIATILGHEIGHAIARHAAEGITKNLWMFIIQIILSQFVPIDLANVMSALLLRLPFSRKMEIGADYIGVLLMASAGYDPRVAPSVYEKLGKISGDSRLRDYLSTHPSGSKRAKLLAQGKIMEEAFSIYREAKAGHGVHGFL